MDREKLKVIAVGMGYKISSTGVYKGVIAIKPDGLFCYYDPINKDDQMKEILEKLKVWIMWLNNPLECHAQVSLDDSMLVGRGKTINEAVCNAAYEYFKDNI